MLIAVGRGVDQQQRAKLLRERLDERLGDDETLWAIYEQLARQHRRKDASDSPGYAPGSLCELEMIERCFKGKKPISVHVLTDDWTPYELDDPKKLLRPGAYSGQSLEGKQFSINKWAYKPPKHGRDVRSVRAWITCQFLVMRGCRQPWLKKHRTDPKLPVLHPEEFVRRFFFAGMEWDNRLIQSTYFNTQTRKVFFYFAPSDG